jgi:hypothetical protein
VWSRPGSEAAGNANVGRWKSSALDSHLRRCEELVNAEERQRLERAVVYLKKLGKVAIEAELRCEPPLSTYEMTWKGLLQPSSLVPGYRVPLAARPIEGFCW